MTNDYGAEIELAKMEKLLPMEKRMKEIRVTANKHIRLNPSMRNELADENGDVFVDLYYDNELKTIVIMKGNALHFNSEKNCQLKQDTFYDRIKELGYAIPAIYRMSWSESLNAWVGQLQEVPKAPVSKVTQKRKRRQKTIETVTVV